MQINSINAVPHQQQKTSFGAYIPKPLKDELLYVASKKGKDASDAFVKQAKKVESWGQDTSSLTMIEKKTKKGREYALALVDSYCAPFRMAFLPKKQNLLDSFMSLKEKNIVDAESKLMF